MPNPEEYRRTRRIIDLMLRIANQPRRWTRRDLAAHYEVSEKQIDKDITLIRHGLVMPLRHSPHGYYFESLATLPGLTLSLPEALSLLLAARLGQQMPGVSGADLSAAVARLEALLPRELRPLVGGLARGEGDDGPRAATLKELQLAIAERARLRIAYRSASGVEATSVDPAAEAGLGGGGGAGGRVQGVTAGPTAAGDSQGAALLPLASPAGSGLAAPGDGGVGVQSGAPGNARGRADAPHAALAGAAGTGAVAPARERVVDPYSLLPYLRSWYLVGYCHLRGEVRMFKVDRIESLARTGERFELPEGFDVATYLGETWGLLRGEAGEPEEVVVEFAAEASPWVRDEQWHPSQRVEDLGDGRVRLHFRAGITAELRRWVLGFGRQARVVRPAHLAEWVLEEARAVAERGTSGKPHLEGADVG